MINISKLYCDQITPGDWLRYGRKGSGERPGEAVPAKASERRPIVVWNITRTCNLRCVHCYNDSGLDKPCNEITTETGQSRHRRPGRFRRAVDPVLGRRASHAPRPLRIDRIRRRQGPADRHLDQRHADRRGQGQRDQAARGLLRGDQSRRHRPDQRQVPGRCRGRSSGRSEASATARTPACGSACD